MRRIVGLFASSAIVVGSIAFAAPAFAAASPPVFTVVCANGNPNASFATTDATLGSVVELTSIVGDSGDQVQIRNRSNLVSPNINANYVCGGGGAELTVTLRGVSTTISSGSSALVSLATGTMTLTLAGKASTTISVTVTGDSGGGGDSSSTATPAPVLETLTIQASNSNTTCTGGNPTGYRGEWMTLPAADACSQTGPDAKPNAKLLGWATNPNFPVAIAQRQVNNGWGAYETFNADGQLTGVFIPAGGATFVSASNNLYPIWSS